MKKIALFPGMLGLFLVACHKDKKHDPEPEPIIRQYSYWTVNGDSFSTNHVEATIGKARMDLYSENAANLFFISFNFGFELPKNGNFTISHLNDPDSANFAYVHVSFHYHDSVFLIANNEHAILSAHFANDKAQYILDPTWYVNYENPLDSVLIQGEFNEP
jgi:hypothetical protein